MAVHPRRQAGGQLDLHRPGLPAGQRLAGLAEQHGLVSGVEHVPGVLVHHDQVLGQGQHDPVGPAAGAQVVLEQLQLLGAGVGQQGLGDLVGGGLDQRDQQPVGVPAPAREVHRADDLA
jgi:hypothetical protein